jgi:hypothetical protein
LIQGLAKPISDIGKTTQSIAETALSVPNHSKAPSTSSSGGDVSLSSITQSSLQTSSVAEERGIIKEVLASHKYLFTDLDSECLNFIEKEGKRNPEIMGGILLELDIELLKNLFTYSYGSWWHKALSNPSILNSQSLDIVNKLRKLKVRRDFSNFKKVIDSEIKDIDLILNRTENKLLFDVIKDYKFKQIFPILNLLPKEKMMTIVKYVYPGEWGQALTAENKNWSLDSTICKELKSKVLSFNPLRDSDEVKNIFEQMDYYKYLNLANTKDEREFYRTLPKNSLLRSKRQPLFEFYEEPDDLIKEVCLNTDLQVLALVIKQSERSESEKIFDFLTERQRYQLRQLVKSTFLQELDEDYIVQVKEVFLNRYFKTKMALESEKIETIEEGHAA